MRRLGIITCQVFEWELAHILNKRKDIDNIYMTRTPENMGFADCLRGHTVKYIKDPYFLPRLSRSVDLYINVLPIGLHIDMDELEYECNECINSMKECVSGILLLYGLCGNALKNIINREDVDIFYPRDNEGIVDYCICSVLGRDCYFEELKRQGSFFMTPGFVNHRDRMIQRIGERAGKPYSTENTNLMLELNEYKRALIVEEGIEDEDYFCRAYDMAKSMNLPVEHTKGSLSLLEGTINSAIGSL